MYLVQQGNTVVADASKPGLLVHQQQPTQQQAWVQPAGNTVMYRGATAPQTSVAVFSHPQAQQLRLSQVPVSTAQVPNHQVLVAGVKTVHPNALSAAAPDNDKQVVYVNVNGTLQRGVLSNGAVYLLSNSTPAAVAAGQHTAIMPQTRVVPPSVGVHAAHPSMQLQKPVMQHVIHNGQLLPVPGNVAIQRMGVQPSAVQQLQPKMQTQMPARPAIQGSVGQILNNQQPVVLTMTPATTSNMAALPSVGHMMPQMVPGTNLHMQPQQQPAVLQAPHAPVLDPRSAASVAAPAGCRPQLVRGMHAHGRPASHPTSASAMAASMLPRTNGGNVAVNHPVHQMVPAGSQAMTIAATLAALPSHTAAGAAHTHELSGPAVPPTTPGIVINAPTPTGQTAPATAAPSKMATGIEAASLTLSNTARTVDSSSPLMLDCPVAPGTVSLTPTGSSPLASQPGTPSRSNSVGTHSSSSSSAGALQAPLAVDPASVAVNSDNDGKLTVMRMFARTFIETGIGLEQALGMIQPADRHLLEAAFAAEVASACQEAQPQAVVPSASGATADPTAQNKLAGLGGEPVSMPAPQGHAKHHTGLQPPGALGVSVDQAAGSSQDSYSLGGWGFSLFSITNAGSMSSAGSGSSFGDKNNQTCINSGGPDTDFSTETAIMLANLQV